MWAYNTSIFPLSLVNKQYFPFSLVASDIPAKKQTKKLIKNNMCFYRVRLSKDLGLDEGITSWDLKNRILRQKLPI